MHIIYKHYIHKKGNFLKEQSIGMWRVAQYIKALQESEGSRFKPYLALNWA